MKTTSFDEAQPSALPQPEALDLAAEWLAQEGLQAAPRVLALLAQTDDVASNETAQVLLVEIVALLLDACASGGLGLAIDALENCPPALAEQGRRFLVTAFFPNGQISPAELDDPAILCLSLLTAAAGNSAEALELIDQALTQRLDPRFLGAARTLGAHIADRAGQPALKLKLIIWDLDDTLWTGTLAEGDAVTPISQRVEFVRTFNRHGVVSAICSKNDHDTARATLEALGLWDEFVFPRIAFVPKGEAVRQLIDDMQLRPANVLFIDDNPHNLSEVAATVPGIHVADATSAECDRLLGELLEANRHVRKSRIADYRIMEARIEARAHSALGNEAFLRESGLHAVVTRWMDNIDFAARAEELVNRSNQLNYTETRIAPGTLTPLIMDIFKYDTRCLFAWDNYGDYGLVGFAMVESQTQTLAHFAFSCRVMHMGLEDFLLARLRQRHPDLDLSRMRKPYMERVISTVTEASFVDPAVRERILAREAPRDPSRIALRLMCDCQSGAFHHYSRFRDEIEFDNMPRLFSLPMMLTGAWEGQLYPRNLVYTPATDYLDWRWRQQQLTLDDEGYADAAARFERMIVEGEHQLLLFLPPVEGADRNFDPCAGKNRSFPRERGAAYNALWRDMAARHADRIHCVDLGGMIGQDDMQDANHYFPPFLQRMAGMIDDWYEARRGG